MLNRSSTRTALTLDLLRTADGRPASEIQLTPAGVFKARDGRPANLPGFRLDAAGAARLVAKLNARKTPLVIDYEHQTLHTLDNGQPAPAAGWFSRVEWREPSALSGGGLFATDVAWTPRAAAMIEAGEYRYISPVIEWSRATGDVYGLSMAALTNDPGIDGMAAVAALNTQLDHADSPTGQPGHLPHEDQPMKALAVLLGLAEGASEADITAAVTALKARSDEQQTALTAHTAELAQLKAETAALKSAKPNPAEYVPVAALTSLQTELAALSSRLNTAELDDLIEQGYADAKLSPALEPWARELGGKDISALRSYLDKTPAIAALTRSQTGGRAPAGSTAGIADDQTNTAVMRQLGLTAEQFAAGARQE